MDKHCVFMPELGISLTDCLKKRKALDISDRSADFGDDNVGIACFSETVDTVFDFIGNMGDNLNSSALNTYSASKIKKNV